jgi:hypothetical protein
MRAAASPPGLFHPNDTVEITQSQRYQLVVKLQRRAALANLIGLALLALGTALAMALVMHSSRVAAFPRLALAGSAFSGLAGLTVLWLRRFSWRATLICAAVAIGVGWVAW